MLKLGWKDNTVVMAAVVCSVAPMNRRDSFDSWQGRIKLISPDGDDMIIKLSPTSDELSAKQSVELTLKDMFGPLIAALAE